MPNSEIAVFVVDDDFSSQEALLALLRAEGITCRAYASATRLLMDASRLRGCVVVDLEGPDLSGAELARALRERGSSLPVIVSSAESSVAAAVQAMKAGVLEFIEKPLQRDATLAAVRHGLDVARAARERELARERLARRRDALTKREREVLTWVLAGRSSKQIGAELGISARTVEVHRAHLMGKMQATSVVDLVRMMAPAEAA